MKESSISIFLGFIFLVLTGVQGTLIGRNGRCSCIDFTQEMIHQQSLKDLKRFVPSPSCEKTEIIATMKNGEQTCLNPDSANVKKLMKEWEKQLNQKKKQKNRKKHQKLKKVVKVKRSQDPHQKKTT
ncbi:C-X-C motif chemokine 9 [Tamandua tetradactyla]|uniref:C-X-C motif chemokine 9 n=1 Tax=Tamandua tetradactyla TaxID=48850 RepID=UPI00405465D0